MTVFGLQVPNLTAAFNTAVPAQAGIDSTRGSPSH
jgi:hypothetical protein